MKIDNRPIGLFDSGIGGLTVLKALAEALPNESFVYLGDTARLPYGSKSPETIERYLNQNVQFLIKHGVKAVVVACNSASTVLLGRDSQHSTLPVYNVIEPGAEAALDATLNHRIGVLGTRATIHSGAYETTILRRARERAVSATEVFSQPCPLLVPLVEEGWEADPLTNLVVYRYVQPLVDQGIDTLILGCTHYPVLREAIERVTRSGIRLVDSASALHRTLARDLASGRIGAHEPKGSSAAPPPQGLDVTSDGTLQILTTDVSPAFLEVARRLMAPLVIPELAHVDIGVGNGVT